jgi:hypothetical protein
MEHKIRSTRKGYNNKIHLSIMKNNKIFCNKLFSLFTANIGIVIIKYVQKYKGHKNIRTSLKEKNKVGSLTFSNMKSDYSVTVIKIVWYCHKVRHISQWNEIGNPENRAHLCEELNCYVGFMLIQWKNIVFSKK